MPTRSATINSTVNKPTVKGRGFNSSLPKAKNNYASIRHKVRGCAIFHPSIDRILPPRQTAIVAGEIAVNQHFNRSFRGGFVQPDG